MDKKLTDRQVECLYYLVKGMTIRQIASQLTLSHRTVEHYLETIKRKLQCNKRCELIEIALKMQEIKDRL
jgi:DNA-binding NarL/FixJ family response regulator